MRRMLPLAVLALLVSATPALAAGPERAPYDTGTLTFAAGDVCGFALEIASVENRAHQLTFPQAADGSVRTKVNGSYLTLVTNLDSAESMLLHAFGPATLVFYVDGSIDLSASGQSVLYFFPGDAIEGLWLATGQYEAHLSADNVITSASITGRQLDLCAALAT